MKMLLLLRRSFVTFRPLEFASKSGIIDRSRVPKIKEDELEEKFVKGWGPGGQSVNKTTNAVFLRHTPTGVWIRCHDSRSLDRNRKIARQMLIEKLDEKLNGEESVAQQEHRLESWRRSLKKEKTRLKYEKIKAEKEEDKGLKSNDIEDKKCEAVQNGGEEKLNSEKNDSFKANEINESEIKTDNKNTNKYKTTI